MQERLINLTFHGIGETDRGLEPGEADTWVDADRFEAILDAVADCPDVRLSFDDGNVSDVEHALPALGERGVRATFFVCAGRLSTPGYVDATGVRRLVAAGMVVGCHGMRHRPWRRLDDCTLHEELVEARRVLEDVAERPVTEAACPFGSYDRRVLHQLRRAGYRHVFTSDRGTAGPDSWVQARNTVGRRDDADVVECILGSERGWDRGLRRRAKLLAKRWR